MLNCLIIDDEPLAREYIAGYIERVSFLKLAGSVRNPAAGKVILEAEAIDVIFLDVKMPQMSGTEFLRQNRIFQQVIFITAYPEYALDGFELEVTDFLMKPVTFERFLKAAEKAKARVEGSDRIKTIKYQPDFIYVRHNQRYEKVVLSEIVYIESMLNYVQIITATGKYVVYSSLKNIEASLPKHQFIRIHKSYIVAVSAVISLSNASLEAGGHVLPVSRANRVFITELVLNCGKSM